MAVQLIPHITPSFTKDYVKGWNTRVIFNHYGSAIDGMTSYTDLTETNLFESNIAARDSKNPYLVFPPYYFKTGHTLRIKGIFLLTGAGDSVFHNNIRIYDDYVGGVPSIIADINSGAGTIVNNNAYTDLPIHYEITLITNNLDNGDGTVNIYAQANGNYIWTTKPNNSDSTAGRSAVMFNSSYYRNIAVGSDVSHSTQLWMDFYNSSITSLKIPYLIVEELE
jgi:hypothetical protein